jgi:hypothetical protein
MTQTFVNSLLFVHTYTQKYSMYIIASSYKYYQKIVAKTGHPAFMCVHYEMVLAAINAIKIFASVIKTLIFLYLKSVWAFPSGRAV